MDKENSFLRDLWENSKTSIALFLGSLLFLAYSVIAVNYEIGRGWNGHPSVQNVLLDISRFIPVAGAAVAALILFIDIIVLLVDWRKKRFQEAIREAVEKAQSEAYKDGYITGQQDRDSEDN